MATSPEIKPAYLLRGSDAAKIDAALGRLRARAEREGGTGALESFNPDGSGPPDAEGLIRAIPALSLMTERRYLLADRVERWSAAQAKAVAAALAAMPPETTVVLAGHEDQKARADERRKAKTRLDSLGEAVKTAGGDVRAYDAPRERELPAHLVAEARRRGFELRPGAARVLADRMGPSTQRLAVELDRLALWAGDGGCVDEDDLREMVSDTSEEAAWALSDALVDRDAALAGTAAERLAEQGESVTALVYQAAKRLREARLALDGLEAGHSARDLERSLPMHPYAAKQLLARVRNANQGDLRAATCAVADLEWWTRGGSDYPDDLALTIAIRRASGAR